MQRRDLMTMTGAALVFAGGRALAQSGSTQGSAEAKVVRIYADDFDVVVWAAGR